MGRLLPTERPSALAWLANASWSLGEADTAMTWSRRLREESPAVWERMVRNGEIPAPFPGDPPSAP